MSHFRDQILLRLKEDLVGPLSTNEVISDRPTQRYSTGILYPKDAPMGPEENQDGGGAVNQAEDAAAEPEEEGVSLHSVLKPAAAGVSFSAQSVSGELPVLRTVIDCAVYEQVAVDDSDNIVDGPPQDRSHERWRRRPLRASVDVVLRAGEQRIDLGPHGISGMELYALTTPSSNVSTATFALSNRRTRGDSLAFDEAQHFFQVQLSVSVLEGSLFVPRPSRRAQTDDDTRTAALIYRDVREYVIGHTCSAHAVVVDKKIVELRTEWVPATVVPRVSDRGDRVFEVLDKLDNNLRPLDAEWLVSASDKALIAGLERLVSCYSDWITLEEARIPSLTAELQAQGRKQIERCRDGAKRMKEGVELLSKDQVARNAFQLAQRAMATQFAWSRPGESLRWRPFQLAFQLLVIPSLAMRTHDDRGTMDLLWFPTGGGKTEAYLGLTAFIIFLRRLRRENFDGLGVAVLMRYTLRLLTVQQFQRASAMIIACELVRRKAAAKQEGLPDLGTHPFGIGLWVGAAATPLTLEQAVSRAPGDPSTPEQLLSCPCCGKALNWRISTRETVVECTAVSSTCAFAESGSRLPVWTIDEEVYRNRPSLLIGTVDKFAQIVRKPETGLLFGIGTSSAPPDLIIQDELHLISGPLGSITGLYEVAIDELSRNGDVRPKIIGSTATIRRAQEQIRALFDRDTYQFPSPGIDAGNSGFAVVDDGSPGRLYVGITTAGRSATYMLQTLVASLLQGAAAPGASVIERDAYWTLVTYFNSLRELGRALVLMQDDVPVSIGQYAARRNENRRNIDPPAELTSRVKTYEIRDMLERLKKRAGDPEAVDLLVASNMISVGMDIPRLGLMVVNAQPKTLSEYIQATSRVGRGGAPGVIITMYNSMRARDRSHFETFETWHRALYRDVEATSVTPFASRAQDKALHAVLVALVRHLVPGMERRPILDDIRRNEAERFASTIEARVARVDPSERQIISQKLERLIEQWASRPDLQTYWDDYNRRNSLLMSAEQFAAKADVDPDLDEEGARRALWPTPNSMREVEPGAPFVLRNVLMTEGT